MGCTWTFRDSFLFTILFKLILISSTLGILYLYYWLGYKGFIGTFIGMMVMGYVLLTDNPKIKGMLRIMGFTHEKNNTRKELKEEINETKERKRVTYKEK